MNEKEILAKFAPFRCDSQEELDRAENAARKRAVSAAYGATEGVNPSVQRKVYNAMKTYIETGIRLMREEVEKLSEFAK